MTIKLHTSNPYCLSCGRRQKTIYRIGNDGSINPQAKTSVCTNKKCPMYIDLEKVENWSRKRIKT